MAKDTTLQTQARARLKALHSEMKGWRQVGAHLKINPGLLSGVAKEGGTRVRAVPDSVLKALGLIDDVPVINEATIRAVANMKCPVCGGYHIKAAACPTTAKPKAVRPISQQSPKEIAWRFAHRHEQPTD